MVKGQVVLECQTCKAFWTLCENKRGYDLIGPALRNGTIIFMGSQERPSVLDSPYPPSVTTSLHEGSGAACAEIRKRLCATL